MFKNIIRKLLLSTLIIMFLVCTTFVLGTPTGGNITYDGAYTIHTFTTNGTFVADTTLNATILIVAGGGSGAPTRGGGGGAGGLLYNTSFTITNNSYTIIVGKGAQGRVFNAGNGYNGEDSIAFGWTAKGGGGGGNDGSAGNTGGSGGGMGGAGTTNQGNNGGTGQGAPNYPAGGGGGAGSVGQNAPSTTQAGAGGDGRFININGSNICYAGGGGGGTSSGGTAGLANASCGGTDGTINDINSTNAVRGGGSGGCGNTLSLPKKSGNGGDGIVIIRYLTEVTPPTYNVTTTNTPNNLSTSTINLTINATITSNMNITANGTATLYYGINTSLNSGCSIFYQKNCVRYNEYTSVSMTQLSNTTFTTILMDNEILPAYYPYNYSWMRNATTYLDTVYSSNNILFNITNFSTQINYTLNLEFDAVNKTNVLSNLLIYYCNYSFILNVGNPSLRPTSCELIDSYSATTNCSHYHGTRCDRAIPVVVSNITKTQNSFIIFVGQSNALNGWDFGYVLNNSYDNSSFRFGNFNAFDSASTITNKIYHIHLHEYYESDQFKYFVNYTSNGTSGISATKYLFYNVSYNPPSASDFINPNCLNTSTLIYTKGSSNSYNFTWTKATSQLKYNITYRIYYSDIYDLYRVSIGNTTNQYLTLNSTMMNTIPSGYSYLYVISDDGIGTDEGKLGCTFNMCENSWTKSVQPCTNNVRLISYYDANSCTEQFNLPSDNSTYESCVAIVYNQTVHEDWFLPMIFLIGALIICTILGFWRPIIFYIGASVLGLMFATEIYYTFDAVIIIVTGLLIIPYVLLALSRSRDQPMG